MRFYLLLFFLLFVGSSLLKAQDKELILAIKNNDMVAVQKALDAGADPNVFDEHGNPVLINGTYGNNFPLVKMLVEKGADANMANQYGIPAILGAVSVKNLEMIDYLVKNGAKLNTVNPSGMTILMSALGMVYTDPDILPVIEYLIQKGADVNAKHPSIGSVLQQSFNYSNRPLTEMLLRNGANPNAEALYYGTFLHAGITLSKPELVKVLVENGAKIEAKNADGETPLFYAVKMMNVAIAHILITHGADPMATNKDGVTCVDYAKQIQNTQLIELLEGGGSAKEAGQAVLDQNLIAAIRYRKLEEVKRWIKEGADVNGRNHQTERTAVHESMVYFESAIVAEIMKHNPDFDVKDVSQMTPFHCLFEVNELYYPEVIAFAKKKLKSYKDLKQTDYAGETALMKAARMGNFELCKLLVANGLSPTRKNSSGATAITLAMEAGAVELAGYLSNPSKHQDDKYWQIENYYFKDIVGLGHLADKNRHKIDSIKASLNSWSPALQTRGVCRVADLYFSLREYEKAERFLLENENIAGSNGIMAYRVAFYLEEGKLEKALQLANTKGQLKGNDQASRSVKLLLAEYTGDYETFLNEIKYFENIEMSEEYTVEPVVFKALGVIYRFQLLTMQADKAFQTGMNQMTVMMGAKGMDVNTRFLSFRNQMDQYNQMGNTLMFDKLTKSSIYFHQVEYGCEHPYYFISLINQANIWITSGDFSRAELIIRKAKEAVIEDFGVYHSMNVQTEKALGILQKKSGNYEAANESFEKALKLTEAIRGKKHYDYAELLFLLAECDRLKGEGTVAQEEYQEVLNILGKYFGDRASLYLKAQRGIAIILAQQKRYAEAEKMFRECIDKAGKDDSQTQWTDRALLKGSFKYELGYILLIEGKHKEALQQFTDISYSMNVWTGKMSPELVGPYIGRSRSAKAFGDMKVAKESLVEAVAIRREQIRNTFLTLTEQEKELMGKSLSRDFNYFYFVGPEFRENDPSILGELYNNQLNTKGIILSSTEQLKKGIEEMGSDSLKSDFALLQRQRNELNALSSNPESDDQVIKALSVRIERLEKKISIGSISFSKSMFSRQYTWQDVQSKLGKDEAAIEIFRSEEDGVIRYYGLLVEADTKEHPKYIEWVNGTDLEKKFIKFYRNAIRNQLDDPVSYKNFWKPIELATSKKRVFISPSGVFNEISFPSLKNPSTGLFLNDEVEVIRITNTRELAQNRAKFDMRKDGVIFGRPHYDVDGMNPAGEQEGTERSLMRDWFRDVTFSDLPGTEIEANNINKTLKGKGWSTHVYLGQEATEENVKAIEHPGVLHLATHGFFINEENVDEKGLQEFKFLGEEWNEISGTDPMLRAGLLLTGATNHLRFPSIPGEDGVLTAREVANMDLSKTSLVVLSACETGLGEERSGEGVYGLQRALKVAGTDAIMMSLWKVSDEATQELMSLMYSDIAIGTSLRTAFVSAQKQLREKYPHPYYWASFTLVGAIE